MSLFCNASGAVCTFPLVACLRPYFCSPLLSPPFVPLLLLPPVSPRGVTRQSRERLNIAWATVQRSTYYKSLDRRSLDLKQEDKKAHVPKILVADIAHRYVRCRRTRRHECPPAATAVLGVAGAAAAAAVRFMGAIVVAVAAVFCRSVAASLSSSATQ